MQTLLVKIRKILKERNARRFFFTRVVSSVAAIVVFVTTYALILPAITLEKTAVCGIEEHQHNDSCYEEILVCGQEESEGHLHTDECYEKVLVCGKEAHTHGEKCYVESGISNIDEEEDKGADANGTLFGMPSEQADAGDSVNTGASDSDSGAGNPAVAPGNPAAAAENSEAAADAQPAAYVPELEPLDMESVLNSHTDLYYYHSEEGEEIPADSAEITDWKKVEEDTLLESTDLVKAYLSYTIPAGSLNGTNPSARYRLPQNIHLSDQQIDTMSRYENGIAVGYRDSDTASGTDGKKNKENYQKYLGAEAVEGDRRPDENLREGTQEYISSVVRAENVYDDHGMFLGQDLIFTFVPYSIEKNQNNYNTDGTLASAGEKITGWFACDFRLDQIDWEQEKIADIILVPENRSEDIREISRVLRMTNGNNVNEGSDESNEAAEATEKSSAQTMTGESEGNAAGSVRNDQTFKAGTLTAEGEDYRITLDYSEEAKIPENASLSVREITQETDKEAYKACLEQASKEVAADDKSSVDRHATRFFDIEILSTEKGSDGKEKTIKIEPSVPVSVQIQFNEQTVSKSASQKSKPDQSDPTVLHFAEEGVEKIDSTVTDTVAESQKNNQKNSLKNSKKNNQKDSQADSTEEQKREIRFEAESFSIYGVIYTVDLRFEVNGKNYLITVTYGPEAQIPQDAELTVEEITEGLSAHGKSYEDYVTYTESALGMEEGSSQYIRLFEISIMKDGQKIQPAEGSSVDVRIELADSSSDSLNVVHFADGSEDGEKVQCSTENGENGSVVQFQAEGFSIYSIVDAPEPYHYGPYKISSLTKIEENTAYKLSYGTGNSEKYFTNEINDSKGSLKEGNSSAAADWYFEKANGDGSTFYIYTLKEGVKKYIHQKGTGDIQIELADSGTAFILSEAEDKPGSFIFKHSTENFWLQHSGSGSGIRLYSAYDNPTNARIYITNPNATGTGDDPYELNGKSFGIAYHDNSVTAAAMSANVKTVNGQNQKEEKRLEGVDMLMRADVLSNSGILLVSKDSDIQEWTFESIEEDKYYIKTSVEGAVKYLCINKDKETNIVNVSLVDDPAHASVIQATPGTGTNSGKWHFTANGYSLNLPGIAANGFNAVNNSDATTWMNLVEKTTLTDDDFVEYSARKISASDELLSATEKDANGKIKKDKQGNPVYKSEKAKVIVYTRVWNQKTNKYEFYAVDHDGSLVRVYDSGDQIHWVGNQVNSALWEFTEYTNDDGTPSNYYELENTAYSNTFLAPQSNGVAADHKVGVNMEGRQEGFDYTSILAWDETAYAYSGLKVEGGKVVPCPKDDADDFYFAVIVPPVLEADPPTTVETVDNDEHGISMRMIDFQNDIIKEGNTIRDSVQNPFFGGHAFSANATDPDLLSTNLTNGYPTTTAKTGQNGRSLSELFDNMTAVNHLFIQSVYNESGYFEYDSTQNFAHLNDNGNFTVYNQLGAIGTSTGDTRTHGQFMPYNNISEQIGYAYDTAGNLITNKTDVLRRELPDSDPRKGEPLYSIPDIDADYFFGMELSASFTQTAKGLDDWGHDIIFEFTGDDDFWLYVDGELVLDLGGIHSAMPGSVNFRTGDVVINKTSTTLYDIFRSNYEARGMTASQINQKLNEIFEEKDVNGRTVHVFKDFTNHTMNMFYMERGAGASNLKMRFNLASVKPGTVELSKKLDGTKSASNKLIQYPYQIWYQMPVYVQDPNGNQIIDSYEAPVRLVQGATSSADACVTYKGSKKLIPFRSSLNIGGTDYQDVFLLKAGETAVIKLPDRNCKYEIIECGVDTEVYEEVSVNGGTITGTLYNNTDTGSTETVTARRQDFGIDYEKMGDRPRAQYINKVAPDVMRTLSFEKVVYDTDENLITPEQSANIDAKFSFRLYLGNEFADQNNLSLANMYHYYIKEPGGSYCRWNSADQRFDSLGITHLEGSDGLEEYLKTASSEEKSAIVFTTSLNGSITNIPAGYTVEVPDLIVGTKYKLVEPDREIPKGYTRRESDGYVRTDLAGGNVVYYTEGDTYGRHPEAGNIIRAEPISDTIADKTESPNIEVRNQEGWGLSAKKEWTDKDFIIHDPIYMAVYLDDGNNNLTLIVDTVRMLNTNETEIYWFFPDLRINGEPKTFDKFVVREVELTVDPDNTPATPDMLTINENGVVTGYNRIRPINDGGSINVKGKIYGGTERTENNYTVNYEPGKSTGHNIKIRTDTVKNSRPGIQIFKTDWDGQNYLAGAEFTLKDSDSHDVGHASYTSDSNGLVTTAYLNEGTFTLTEIKTPFGYTALDEPITVNVTTAEPADYDLKVTSGSTTYYIILSGPSGFYTTTAATETDMARITVKNRTLQELQVVKEGVNGSVRIPLSDVHFALYEQVKDSEGNERPAYNPKTGYEDLVTNAEGILEDLKMTVGAGTYYLREKAAPSGYKLLPEDLCFTIGANGTVKINNAGYTNWLRKDTSVAGTVSYTITIENTPLGITVRKIDETGSPLIGSKFKLCIKNDEGSFVVVTDYGLGSEGVIDLTDITEMTFSSMANGTYMLTETNTPQGYIITTKDIYFTVANGAVTLTDADGNAITYSDVSLHDDNTTIAVKNYSGAALPHTGGPGTRLLYLLGGALILFAVVRGTLSGGRFH